MNLGQKVLKKDTVNEKQGMKLVKEQSGKWNIEIFEYKKLKFLGNPYSRLFQDQGRYWNILENETR